MIPPAKRPYLSAVVTARNDDHGGNLLRRLQTFLNALAAQAKRHNLPIELVLVEWNPPSGKPRLSEALRWPHDCRPFQARIITVSPDLHSQYRFANALPLYQMIGKNVGIRRAQGEFILATNIDILFSDELMEFLAARTLEQDRMYRIDRTDVAADVPVDASIDEQLAYCRAHQIRLNAIDGTVAFTTEGSGKPILPDVIARDSGVAFGAGWYPPEQHFGHLFRWSTGDSVIDLAAREELRALVLEIESGPGTNFGAFSIQMLDSAGNVLAEAPVEKRRSCLSIQPRENRSLRLRVVNALSPTTGDPRTLAFRVLHCEWKSPSANKAPLEVLRSPARVLSRAWLTLTRGVRFIGDFLQGKGSGRIGLPISRAFLDRLQIRPEGSAISIALRGSPVIASPGAEARPAPLHTNACGDFTLAHRNHWFELRGYPEFDLYSMNIDSLFCYMAHYGGAAEQVLCEPMRIYHIEHATGSGWTPEGSHLLFERLAAKGIPSIEFDEVLRWASEMERFRTPLIFNREDWGLGEFSLPEQDMCHTPS